MVVSKSVFQSPLFNIISQSYTFRYALTQNNECEGEGTRKSYKRRDGEPRRAQRRELRTLTSSPHIFTPIYIDSRLNLVNSSGTLLTPLSKSSMLNTCPSTSIDSRSEMTSTLKYTSSLHLSSCLPNFIQTTACQRPPINTHTPGFRRRLQSTGRLSPVLTHSLFFWKMLQPNSPHPTTRAHPSHLWRPLQSFSRCTTKETHIPRFWRTFQSYS